MPHKPNVLYDRSIDGSIPIEDRLTEREHEAKISYLRGKDPWKKIRCPHCGETIEVM